MYESLGAAKSMRNGPIRMHGTQDDGKQRGQSETRPDPPFYLPLTSE
jgi:hypothetical protein